MKRASPYDSNSNSPSTSNPRRLPQKRSKTNPACTACKKSKTRCEVLETLEASLNAVRCHRCNVLKITCSFEEAMQDASRNTSSRAESSSSASTPAPVPTNSSLQLLANASVWRRPEPAVPSLNIERLSFPVPPNSTWNGKMRTGSVDWLDTAVYAIRDMARGSPATGDGSMDHVDSVLRDILTPRQIESLLQRSDRQLLNDLCA